MLLELTQHVGLFYRIAHLNVMLSGRSGAEAASKHLSRVYRIIDEISKNNEPSNEDVDLLKDMHRTIRDVPSN